LFTEGTKLKEVGNTKYTKVHEDNEDAIKRFAASEHSKNV